jgi:hypothetical protein
MVSESSEIMQFWVTIATDYQVLTLHMNVSYVVGLFVSCVYSLSAYNILMWICEVCFIFTMEYDFVYEHLEDLFSFQNMHVEDVCIDHFSKIISRALIKNQKDNPIGHYIGLYKEQGGSVLIHLLEFTSHNT